MQFRGMLNLSQDVLPDGALYMTVTL